MQKPAAHQKRLFSTCTVQGTNLTNTKLQTFHTITRIHIKLQKITKIHNKLQNFCSFFVILCEFL
jgi:hypothetical protein